LDPQSPEALSRLDAVRHEIEALIDVRAYGPLARAQQRRYDDLVALERQLLRWLNGGPSDLSEAATS